MNLRRPSASLAAYATHHPVSRNKRNTFVHLRVVPRPLARAAIYAGRVMWIDDLATLGYPASDGAASRALTRFQRRALTPYRKTVSGESVSETPLYAGPADAIAHPETLEEIARWLSHGYRVPLGYFTLSNIGNWGRLRQDAAAAWLSLMPQIEALGGSIAGPYGDTKRPIMKTISPGASRYSFHICGRAVDLNQGNRSYFPSRETQGPQTLWRIWCRAADQTGAQGSRVAGIEFHDFLNHTDVPLPDGYYFDLTAAIETSGLFERIPAQDGWEREYQASEWWHFQWVPEKQKTFQDECELIGITEQELRDGGYSDADLDHQPG